MNKVLKKKKEKFFVEQFLDASSLFNGYIMDENDKKQEKPDIIVESGESKIGIEVTNIYTDRKNNIGSKEVENDSIFQDVLNQAHIQFQKESFHVNVSIEFSVNFRLKDQCSLIDDLIKIVKNHSHYLSPDKSILIDEGLPKGIKTIDIYGLPDNVPSFWTIDRAGFETIPSKEKIDEIILNKNEALKNYIDVQIINYKNTLSKSSILKGLRQ